MSFLTDPNLTFHRFSDGTISSDGRKVMRNESQVWTTGTPLDFSSTNPTLAANDSATSRTRILTHEDDEVSKRYSTYSSTGKNSTVNATHSGSTMKLIQVQRKDSANDSSNKQVRADSSAAPLLTLVGKVLKVALLGDATTQESHRVTSASTSSLKFHFDENDFGVEDCLRSLTIIASSTTRQLERADLRRFSPEIRSKFLQLSDGIFFVFTLNFAAKVENSMNDARSR